MYIYVIWCLASLLLGKTQNCHLLIPGPPKYSFGISKAIRIGKLMVAVVSQVNFSNPILLFFPTVRELMWQDRKKNLIRLDELRRDRRLRPQIRNATFMAKKGEIIATVVDFSSVLAMTVFWTRIGGAKNNFVLQIDTNFYSGVSKQVGLCKIDYCKHRRGKNTRWVRGVDQKLVDISFPKISKVGTIYRVTQIKIWNLFWL